MDNASAFYPLLSRLILALKFCLPSDFTLLFNPSKSRSKRPYVAFSPIALISNERAYIGIELQLELQF